MRLVWLKWLMRYAGSRQILDIPDMAAAKMVTETGNTRGARKIAVSCPLLLSTTRHMFPLHFDGNLIWASSECR